MVKFATMRTHFMLFALLALAVSCGQHPDDPVENPALAVPSGLKVVGTTNSSLSFTWDAVDGATQYYARLTDAVDNIVSGGQKDTKVPEVTFSGLSGGTDYKLKVKAVSPTRESVYSSPLAARTDPDPVIDPPAVDPPVDTTSGSGSGSDPSGIDPIADPAARYEAIGIPTWEEDGIARAFPGAEGGGMLTTGGRGGKVLHVTNLNDSGEGSLRWAVEQKGARTVVFDVAGIIELQSDLVIQNGDLTIAGQTAPGDGICLKNRTTNVKACNVIIRFIRFRLGDEYPWTESDIKAGKADGQDAVWGRYQDNVIIDHCSMSWCVDECASFYANRFFTLQWCILTESMAQCRLHSKGSHGYGGIWGGRDATFHHNLLSCHNNRTPRFDHPNVYDATSLKARRGNVDHRNNVIYNWGSGSGCYGGNGSYINMVANYYKPGPASKDRKFFIQADCHYTTSNKDSAGKTIIETYQYPYLYMEGNVHTKYPELTADNSKGVNWSSATNSYNGDVVSNEGHLLAAPLEILAAEGAKASVTTHSAEAALEKVCAWAGASLRRDSVDGRATSDALSGIATCKDGGNGSKNGIIDSPSAVGGWPSYSASDEEKAAVKDTDGDGMPDDFEKLMCLDPSDPSDGALKTLDPKGRYTNLEMYLHYLVKDIVRSQVEGGSYKQN